MRALIFLLIAATACAEDEPLAGDAGVVPQADATVEPDATVHPDAEPPPPSFIFESTDPAGPALVFTNAVFDATELSVLIAGRGLSNVHGVAFRIVYDPNELTFVEVIRAAFPTEGLQLSGEGRPGVIVAAYSQIGAQEGIELDGVAIARAAFRRNSEGPAALRLERGFSLDARGMEIKVAVGSGRLIQQ